MEQAIQVKGLQKSYGEVHAVRGIDFDVAPGEVFGLLGPNGAGKTTTVEILEGLRPRTSGDVKVLGCDPGVEVKALKDRIGVCLQSTNLPDKITVREALALFASFYSRNTDIDQLIDRLQLSEKRERVLPDTLRRSEAAGRTGAGPGQRSATGVSRRADHRPRSAGTPGDSQPDQRTARCQADHSDHHALHRGSGAPVRPRRDRRSGADHRPRHAARDSGAYLGHVARGNSHRAADAG